MSAVRRLVFGPETLAQLRAAAEAAESELLWLLDEDAEPDSATLPALLEAGHVPVASLPLGAAGGEPLEAAVGRFATAEPAALLEAAQARYVPLRHAFLTSLLVARASVLELDPPDPARFGRWAGSEWTARLFTRHPGRLVPASTVRMRPPARDREPLTALRAARAAQWGRGETLRALYGSLTR